MVSTWFVAGTFCTALFLLSVTVAAAAVYLVRSNARQDEQRESTDVFRNTARLAETALRLAVDRTVFVTGAVQGTALASTCSPERLAVVYAQLQTVSVIAIGPNFTLGRVHPSGVVAEVANALQPSAADMHFLRQVERPYIVGMPTNDSTVLSFQTVFSVEEGPITTTGDAAWGYTATLFSLPTVLGPFEADAVAARHAFRISLNGASTATLYETANLAGVAADSVVSVGTTELSEVLHVLNGQQRQWTLTMYRQVAFSDPGAPGPYLLIVLGCGTGALLVTFIVLVAQRALRPAKSRRLAPFALVAVALDVDETTTNLLLSTQFDRERVWTTVCTTAEQHNMMVCHGGAAAGARDDDSFGGAACGDGVAFIGESSAQAVRFSAAAVDAVRETRGVVLRTLVEWCTEGAVVQSTVYEDQMECVGTAADGATEVVVCCPAGYVTVTSAVREAVGGTYVALGRFLRRRAPALGMRHVEDSLGAADHLAGGLWLKVDGDPPHSALNHLGATDTAAWAGLLETVKHAGEAVGNVLAGPVSPSMMSHHELGNSRPGTASTTGRSSSSPSPLRRRVDALVRHPAFAPYAPAPPWMPAQTCDDANASILKAILNEYLAVAAETTTDGALLAVASYYLFAYQFLFAPLAPAEQRNVMRRLQVACGIPDQCFVHRLAVHCAIHGLRTDSVEERSSTGVSATSPLHSTTKETCVASESSHVDNCSLQSSNRVQSDFEDVPSEPEVAATVTVVDGTVL